MKEGFIQKALKILGIGDYEDEYEEIRDEDDFSEREPPRIKQIRTRHSQEKVLTAVPGEKPTLRVHIIEPTSFNDSQVIADKFRLGIPVIVNLSLTDLEVGRRIIDFSSGVVYALRGTITPIASKVYLLTPKNVVITPDEKQRLRESFFNQY